MNPIILEIQNPEDQPARKYWQAVSILEKALHFKPIKEEHKHEESPVRALRELKSEIENQVDVALYTVFKDICTKWLGVAKLHKARYDYLPYKLNNKIFINPKTGKPLTNKEWRAITEDVRKMTSWAFKDAEEAVVKRAMALGKILESMSFDSPLSSFKPIDVEDLYLKNAVTFARQNAAEYITGVSDALRKDIKTTIIQAQKGKWSTRDLEDALFDKFAIRNRDFRMIAETELNTNAVNAHLLAQLEIAKKEKKVLYVKGVSNENACSFCKANINRRLFVVLPEAPEDTDQVEINGKLYEAIWPGKSNINRSKANWWSAVPAHPHCACWYTVYNPTYAKYHEKLEQKLQQMKAKAPVIEKSLVLIPSELAKAVRKPYQDKLGRWWQWNGSKYVYVKKSNKQTKEVEKPKTTNLVLAKNKDSLPGYIKALRIPPAWKNICYSKNPKADLLATGLDSKGRKQYIYSDSFAKAQTIAKFNRINNMNKKYKSIKAENDQNIKKGVEEAICLDLIFKVGLRPGSDKDTKAAQQAYGATTLEGRHIVVKNGKVNLEFVGKKGVSVSLPVECPDLTKILIERKKKVGSKGRIFNTNSVDLLLYTTSLDGGGFKTKDIRTYLGTKTAMLAMREVNAPTNKTQYKKAVLAVARAVSTKLGNTPTIALQSYINPAIFEEWKEKANVSS